MGEIGERDVREIEMKPISVVKCDSWKYEYSPVKAALETAFNDLGGISYFMKPGDKILLKVNLVMKKAPEAAATSHPVFVQALAELLIAQGAEVVIGDSPGGPFNEMRLRSVYQGCGMKEAAERSGARLNFETGSSETLNPRGLLLKKLTNLDVLRQVNKVINVARLKTHGMMKMTGAVKNLFGTVPGTLKAEYHLNRSEPEQFADALIDICLCADPVLSFLDGIVAMEGDGPTSGTPRNAGVVLASADPFGLDLAAARIIGVSPRTIPTVKRGIERGLCPEDYRKLIYVKNKRIIDNCIEDPLAEFLIPDFKAPAVKLVNPLSGGRTPRFVKRFADRWGQPYPVFLPDACIGCGECLRSCPPGAISMVRRETGARSVSVPDPGLGSGLDPGFDPASDPWLDPRFHLGLDPRLDLASDPGLDPRLDLASDSGLDPRLDPASDSGLDPGLDLASDPGLDPGLGSGFDPASVSLFIPAVNLSLCIRCFCCQELCPKKAVEIRRPWLFRIMAGL